ncbi:MAG TPA: hypothetical protein VMT89_16390, partial [Candidatus Acidoferrales bacterium]|nr:hypothetical protein [Candidatus Acidoferrales bacterium]
RQVNISFSTQSDKSATGVTVLLAYRDNLVALPGKGSADSVRKRITDTPKGAVVAVNDLDYAVRLVIARGEEIPAGRLALVSFDSCQNTAVPSAADFSCVVEGCATIYGNIATCSCSVSVE